MSMKKKILKNWKRIAAVMLAAVMVVGSVNLSGFVVNAAGDGDGSPNPWYDSGSTHKYIYNGYNEIGSDSGYYNKVFGEDGNFVKDLLDVLGAATHVHLFAADEFYSCLNTHGNIF